MVKCALWLDCGAQHRRFTRSGGWEARAVGRGCWVCGWIRASWLCRCVSGPVSTLFPPLHSLAGGLCFCSAISPGPMCQFTLCWSNRLVWRFRSRFSRDGLIHRQERGWLPMSCIILHWVIQTIVSRYTSQEEYELHVTLTLFSSQRWFEATIILWALNMSSDWMGLGLWLFQVDVLHHWIRFCDWMKRNLGFQRMLESWVCDYPVC